MKLAKGIQVDPQAGLVIVDHKPLRITYGWVGYSDVLECKLDEASARFVLSGSPTGEHTLDAASTDAERLVAHWRGYVENAERCMGVQR